MSACTPTIGIWAAILLAIFATCFSVVALAANLTTLIPAIWVNPLSFAPSLLLAWSYLVLMGCVLDTVSPEHRIWAIVGLCFAMLYAAINSMVYFVQLVVVTPLIFQGNANLAGVLAFEPRSAMLSLNGLAYGLMSTSAFFAAFTFPWHAQRFVRRVMWAHGALGPIVIAAIFWPPMTYVGALDIDVSCNGTGAGVALPYAHASQLTIGQSMTHIVKLRGNTAVADEFLYDS